VPIPARVLYRVAVAVGEKHFQAHVQTDRALQDRRGREGCFTDNQGIPVSIGAKDKVTGLRCSFERAVHLDLEALADLLRNTKVSVFYPGILANLKLSELNGVPLIAGFETREPGPGVCLLAAEKAAQGLVQPVGESLDGCSRNLLAASFEGFTQVVFGQKLAVGLIPCLRLLKHLVIEMAGFTQAIHEQETLYLCGIEPVFKGSHAF
jgi:hypothetical protein